jgi:hypothetical protein
MILYWMMLDGSIEYTAITGGGGVPSGKTSTSRYGGTYSGYSNSAYNSDGTRKYSAASFSPALSKCIYAQVKDRLT